MKKIGMAMAVMVLLSALCGLFGCSKAPEYTVGDICSVSISCGHMNYSYSYSFYLRKKENAWLLDAEYAVDTEQPRTEFEGRSVTEEDANNILAVVQEQNVIGKLQRWKKPKIDLEIADETTYYTSLLFADGKQIAAATHISDDLVSEFYRLAEKYSDTVTETDDAE